jgi:hexokinase
LRVVLVTLEGQGKYKTVSSKSRVSDELKTGPMRNLCGMLFNILFFLAPNKLPNETY